MTLVLSMYVDDSVSRCRNWNPGGTWITKNGDKYKDNYNLRNGEITKWYEVSKYSQIYTLRNGNLYFTKWENILYEMRKFLMDIRIYILRNGNCMVTILKSILYEMRNNQV